MTTDVSWVAILSALLLAVGVLLGIAATVASSWMLMALGLVFEVSGLGWAVLAGRE